MKSQVDNTYKTHIEKNLSKEPPCLWLSTETSDGQVKAHSLNSI